MRVELGEVSGGADAAQAIGARSSPVRSSDFQRRRLPSVSPVHHPDRYFDEGGRLGGQSLAKG